MQSELFLAVLTLGWSLRLIMNCSAPPCLIRIAAELYAHARCDRNLPDNAWIAKGLLMERRLHRSMAVIMAATVVRSLGDHSVIEGIATLMMAWLSSKNTKEAYSFYGEMVSAGSFGTRLNLQTSLCSISIGAERARVASWVVQSIRQSQETAWIQSIAFGCVRQVLRRREYLLALKCLFHRPEMAARVWVIKLENCLAVWVRLNYFFSQSLVPMLWCAHGRGDIFIKSMTMKLLLIVWCAGLLEELLVVISPRVKWLNWLEAWYERVRFDSNFTHIRSNTGRWAVCEHFAFPTPLNYNHAVDDVTGILVFCFGVDILGSRADSAAIFSAQHAEA